MNFKPSDLLFGIVDFLAFIVPGMILIMTIPIMFSIHLPGFSTLAELNELSKGNLVVFILLSYIFGHFLHFIAAKLLEYPSVLYVKAKKGKEKYANFIRESEICIKKMIPGYEETDRVADAFVRLKNPQLIPELEKYLANSKLFRSLCLLCIYLCFYPGNTLWEIITLIICSILSFLRFANQKWKRLLVTYEFFILIHKEDKS